MYTRAQQCDGAYRQLLRGRYGPPPPPPRFPVPLTLTTESADAGTETVRTPSGPVGAEDPAGPAGSAAGGPVEEYVVVRGEPPQASHPPQAPQPGEPAQPPAPDAGSAPPAAGSPPAGVAAPSAAPVTAPAPSPGPLPSPVPSPVPPPEPDPLPPPTPAPEPARDAGEPEPAAEPLEGTIVGDGPASGQAVSEEDLAADMQAILSGRRVYDSSTGTMRDRQAASPPPADAANRPPAAASPPRPSQPSPPPPVPEASGEQSIFNRIAEQLEYSNSFDLGDHELQRRFESFDQFAEQQSAATPRRRRTAPASRHGAAPPATPPAAPAAAAARPASTLPPAPAVPAAPPAPPIPAADFRAVYDRAPGPWTGLPGRDAGLDAGAFAAAAGGERSAAFFDTGEHVLAGEVSGVAIPLTVAGVQFTYGDIISMGDFFDSADQLLAASSSELSTLKGLIDRSTAYYRSPSGPHPVSNEDWDRATGGRYLRLAEDNYSHFAPAATSGESFATRHGDHRTAWEDWHERAVRAAHEEHSRAGQSSPALVTPLTINAFGDHFLTDAFASGHLVNKELVIDRFRRRFFTGSALNTAGRSFFVRVAEKAFVGRVAERFSDLETTSYPVCAWGFCVPWRPNINSVSRFTTLLEAAAELEPVKIANVAVKALHDHLNATGVPVVNQAGDPEWTLHGDGHLDTTAPGTTTLDIMRRAVDRSVADLSDPAIMASGYAVRPLLDRVWAITPRPTAAGTAQLRAALRDFTDPGSARLVDAAAGILTEQLDATIAVLLASGQLKHA